MAIGIRCLSHLRLLSLCNFDYELDPSGHEAAGETRCVPVVLHLSNGITARLPKVHPCITQPVAEPTYESVGR
jgi:hypothetical protein